MASQILPTSATTPVSEKLETESNDQSFSKNLPADVQDLIPTSASDPVTNIDESTMNEPVRVSTNASKKEPYLMKYNQKNNSIGIEDEQFTFVKKQDPPDNNNFSSDIDQEREISSSSNSGSDSDSTTVSVGIAHSPPTRIVYQNERSSIISFSSNSEPKVTSIISKYSPLNEEVLSASSEEYSFPPRSRQNSSNRPRSSILASANGILSSAPAPVNTTISSCDVKNKAFDRNSGTSIKGVEFPSTDGKKHRSCISTPSSPMSDELAAAAASAPRHSSISFTEPKSHPGRVRTVSLLYQHISQHITTPNQESHVDSDKSTKLNGFKKMGHRDEDYDDDFDDDNDSDLDGYFGNDNEKSDESNPGPGGTRVSFQTPKKHQSLQTKSASVICQYAETAKGELQKRHSDIVSPSSESSGCSPGTVKKFGRHFATSSSGPSQLENSSIENKESNNAQPISAQFSQFVKSQNLKKSGLQDPPYYEKAFRRNSRISIIVPPRPRSARSSSFNNPLAPLIHSPYPTMISQSQSFMSEMPSLESITAKSEDDSSEKFKLNNDSDLESNTKQARAISRYQHTIHILIAVTGSVATIKVPLIISKLREIYGRYVVVQVIVTSSAKHFLSTVKMPQGVKVWHDDDEWSSRRGAGSETGQQLHVQLRRWADILLIAPLSANTLAKLASGICDNLVTSVFRAWNPKTPVIVAPAMNTHMYMNPMTKKHLDILKHECPYVTVLRPLEKVSIRGDIGMGGMREWTDVVENLVRKLGLAPLGNNPREKRSESRVSESLLDYNKRVEEDSCEDEVQGPIKAVKPKLHRWHTMNI